jgi:hypothetical protein
MAVELPSRLTVVFSERKPVALPRVASLRNVELRRFRQIRLLKKRLGISAEDLLRTVEKVGHSIAVVSKEVKLQKASALRETILVSAKEISATAPTSTPLVENLGQSDEIRQ